VANDVALDLLAVGETEAVVVDADDRALVDGLAAEALELPVVGQGLPPVFAKRSRGYRGNVSASAAPHASAERKNSGSPRPIERAGSPLATYAS
jgi:hypothetical protein